MKDLVEVITIALACMMTVFITGEVLRTKTQHEVPCSYSMYQQAYKLGITIVGSCIVEE